MIPAAHVFVAVLFAGLGLAFTAPTAFLIWEFGSTDWPTLLVAHSHLFFFFPVFGVLALVAFYRPSVAFTDFYWCHVKLGRVRFVLGFLLVAASAAWFGAGLAKSELRSVWEIAPDVLQAELRARSGEATPCLPGANACRRQPLLSALQRVRELGQSRSSISELQRNCKFDPLVQRPVSDGDRRYCFPAAAMLNVDDCCRVQQQFRDDVRLMAAASGSRSVLSRVDEVASYFKSFFIIVIFVIGALLVVWQRRIRELYPNGLEDIENGIIIGAVAMVFWFLMDYAYQQTSDLLFGRQQAGFPIRLSFIIVPWAVLLMLYFTRSVRAQDTQINPGQLLIALLSSVAAVQYDKIANLSFRLLGAGAEWWIYAFLLCISLLMLILILFPNVLQTVFGQLNDESSRKSPPLT